MSYSRVCKLLAAKRCYESGQTIKSIAASAKVSESTIRRWLKQTNTIRRKP